MPSWNGSSEAREYFEKFASASEEFTNIPDETNYSITLALAAYVAYFLGDTPRAEILYGILKPYDGLNIAVVTGLLCTGAASRILGILATTMSHWDEAEAHYLDGIAMNERIGAAPWLAHGRLEYAQMLLARDQPGDRQKALDQVDQALPIFQELGMKGFMEQALTLKLRGQGILTSAGARTSIDAVAAGVQGEHPDLRAHAAPDGTVTILFSDIEGSTQMTERLGDQRWLQVLREHNRIVREQVAAHGGFEVKSQGDGFMIAFQSARRALLCAVAIQRAFAAYGATHTDEPCACASACTPAR